MEEQFILRVPPSVAERIERLLSENESTSDDKSLDLSFSESYKTYDDSVLIKTADIGQMIMVREEGDPAPDMVEYRHGLTPPLRDARRRRFRREPDLNPEVVQRVEKDLLNIMAGGTAEVVQEEDGEDDGSKVSKKNVPALPGKPIVPDIRENASEPDRSDSDRSNDSI